MADKDLEKPLWDAWRRGECRHEDHAQVCCPSCIAAALKEQREKLEARIEALENERIALLREVANRS